MVHTWIPRTLKVVCIGGEGGRSGTGISSSSFGGEGCDIVESAVQVTGLFEECSCEQRLMKQTPIVTTL